MDDNAPKENPPADFNKLNLNQLQGFSFGTQWTQDKSSPSDRRDSSSERAPRQDRRDDRRGPAGGGVPDRRDRRDFRKPAGAPAGESRAPFAPEAPAPGAGAGPAPRREFSGERAPRRDDGGGYRGGPGGGDRGGPRYGARNDAPVDRGPYDSPYFAATFYPEDTSFNTLVKTIRASCRTIELFEIARTVVAKPDRFVVVVARKPAESAPGVEPEKKPFYISVPDGVPFETDESAVAHVLNNHLTTFFDSADVEIDPPKGNFQVVNKCTITGELLGPPNYHRYNQLVAQHHAAKVSRMSLEAFRSRIETVRDPEAIAQWLEKMKKTTRYTWKVAPAKPAASAPVPSMPAAEEATPTAEVVATTETPAIPAEATVPVTAFDSLEDARVYLLTHARDKVVRTSESVRVTGKAAEAMPVGEIRRAIEGALERQQRFPLDTANALRGRLRREHFTIFKKGSKGVSYVCAVKRKFRVPGQVFSESIGALISFIESHPMIRASELPIKFLGIKVPAAPKPPAPVAAPADGTPAAETPPAPAEPALTIDERAKLVRMQGDLVWLVREGYVTEFIDGRLFAAPPVVEARKKEAEAAEHDPENFPEAPPAEAPATMPAAAPLVAVPAAFAPEVPTATVEATPAPALPSEEPTPPAS